MDLPNFRWPLTTPQHNVARCTKHPVDDKTMDVPHDEFCVEIQANERKSIPKFSPWRIPASVPYNVQTLGPPHLRTFKSQLPLHLTRNLEYIIDSCNRYAASHHGWTTNLFSVTKQDIALADVAECARLSHEITIFVTNVVRVLFGAQVYMDRQQPHVLRYDASHPTTPLHHDQCHLTINLMLSSKQSYEGGGTYVCGIGKVLLEQGEFLVHPGPLLHRGVPITDGARHLLVYFVNFIHPPLF